MSASCMPSSLVFMPLVAYYVELETPVKTLATKEALSSTSIEELTIEA